MAKPPPASVVAFMERTRLGLRSLERKMAPPNVALLGFVSDLWGFQIAYTLADLGVPDALERGPRSSTDVARELGLDEDLLYRLLRAATNIDLVREHEGKRFALRPMGEVLCRREGETFRDFIVMMGRLGCRFWARLGDALREGKTAVEIETGKPLFEYLLADESSRVLFNRAMTAVSSLEADAFVAAYDVSSFGRVVDVGGGHGRLLAAILRAAPQARGTLFDLAEMVEGAVPLLEKYEVRDRIELVAGSFFDRVPEGGDLYVMKSIVHDWQDDQASKILGNVRRALQPHAKLVLCETVVPGPNEKHFSKFLDVEMIVHTGGRERTRDEFTSLLRRNGFELKRILRTAGPTCILEADPI